MKKILLSLCLLIMLSVSAEAQVRPPRPHHRQQPRRTVVQPRQPRRPARTYNPIGEFRFHVLGELGVGDFGAVFHHDIPYHFSIGGMAEYQVGHVTSLGLGAEFYSSYGENCVLLHNMQETYLHTLPIYANLRLTVPGSPITPFIEGRLGYSIPLNTVTCLDPTGEHHYQSTGLYTGGAIGMKIYKTNISLGLSVIDVVDADQGFKGGRKDIITDYYVRLSFAL